MCVWYIYIHTSYNRNKTKISKKELFFTCLVAILNVLESLTSHILFKNDNSFCFLWIINQLTAYIPTAKETLNLANTSFYRKQITGA